MYDFDYEKSHSENNIRSYEYQRRFITSLTVASAASLVSLISFSQDYQDAEAFLNSNLTSIWAFLISFVLSGSVPYFLSKKHAARSNISAINSNEISMDRASIAVTHQRLLSLNERGFLFKMKDGQDYGELSSKAYQIWKHLSNMFLFISVVFFLTGLVFPIIKITLNGSLV